MNRSLLVTSIVAMALFAACASTPKQPAAATAAAAAKPAAPAAAAAMNISGTWALSLETPMGARDMKLTAAQTGETLTGSIGGPQGATPINGTVKGNAVAFGMKVNAQGMDMQVDYKGTVDGNAMKGTAKFGEFGEGAFTAKKE